MRKIVLLNVCILLTVLLVSCSKSPKPVVDSAKTVAGTYQGFLTSTNLKTTGVAEVDSVNDSMVSIHCYDSTGFDTTFVMQMFQNGSDTIMLCSTGQAFFDQYGHNMYSMMGSMMGGWSGMNAWQQFMQTQHDPGNGNYGSFDMMNGTFYYPFTTDSTEKGTLVFMTFNGSKH